MMRKSFLLLGLFVVVTALGVAKDPNPIGDLKVYVAVSDNPDYVKKWVETGPSEAIHISRVRRFRVGGIAYIAFIITGYGADSDGLANLWVDVVITAPDGSRLLDQESFARFNMNVGDGPAFVMADPALDLGFDPGDLDGTWKVRATVRDLVLKLKAVGSESIELLADDEA